MHATQAPPSSLQPKVEPDSLELKVKLAVVAVVLAGGPALIAVCGGEVSGGGGVDVIVQLRVAGVVSTLPAGSVARTEN